MQLECKKQRRDYEKIIRNVFGFTYWNKYICSYLRSKIGLSNDFLEQDALYFNIGLDVYGEQRSILQPGIGVIIADFVGDTNDSNIDTGLSTRFDSLPVFGIAKFNLLGVGDSVFFLKAFGGWQFISEENVEGGPYYGYGLGFDISSISVEYFITKETYEINGIENNDTFGTIGVGYYY